MKRWGVRWIFCWLSVLITTACGHVLNSPTPTDENTDPVPTLQNFIPPSTASPAATVRPQTTITPHQFPQSTSFRLATITPSPNLVTEDPTCYETSVRSLICLGWVQNNNTEPLTNTIIHFYLLNAQGDLLAAEEIPTSLTIIPAQEGSPYRVIFEQVPEQAWSVYTEINYVEVMPKEQYVPPDLQVIRQQIDWADNGYQIQGDIRVEDSATARVRIVVSVRSENGHLTGFRVLDVDLVDKQASFALSIAPLDNQPGEVRVQVESLP